MLRLFFALAEHPRRLLRVFASIPRQAAIALGAPGLSIPARPQRLGQAMLVVLPLAFFAAAFMPSVTLVMTPSIEAWIVRPSPGPIRRGDYVMFSLRGRIAGPRPVKVTKHALCLPGDRLTMSETPSRLTHHAVVATYYCNGQQLGVSLPRAGNGMWLRHMRWSGIIPSGKAYVGSHHLRGFDSRYFGLVPLAHLTRMERLL
jgi:type IV secretory pathway protease TraF